MNLTTRITPCLWFDDQAEAAAELYVSTFPESRITQIARYGEAGQEIHRKPAGSVMTVGFELNGQPFTALNGGAVFQFNEAISLEVHCDTQEQIDYFWEKLGEGGDPAAQQCGWLKDRFGLSWQIVPKRLPEMMHDHMSEATQRAMEAMLRMKKLDIEELERAYAG